MDGYLFRRKPSPIDELISAVREEMVKVGVTDESYPKLMSHLKDLYEIKKIDDRNLVGPDTLFSVLGNLFGLGMIMTYEKAHATSSRGFSHLMRPKSP